MNMSPTDERSARHGSRISERVEILKVRLGLPKSDVSESMGAQRGATTTGETDPVSQMAENATSFSQGPVPASEVDFLLTAQLGVAWAGEEGEEPRLGWWRSDLASEFGGEDLFRRLLPSTWRWATLQGARAAAMRRDHEIRTHDHDPDRLLTLYNPGFEIDERAEERLQQLKRSGQDPMMALPGLSDAIAPTWEETRFADWVSGHGETEFAASPVGRRIKGSFPRTLDFMVRRLVGALYPLAQDYPSPHFRRES